MFLKGKGNPSKSFFLTLSCLSWTGSLLEKIKNSPFANIPIIVASQANENDSELKALEMGAVDFVTKPYSPSIILQRIINTIAMRENAILKKYRGTGFSDQII